MRSLEGSGGACSSRPSSRRIQAFPAGLRTMGPARDGPQLRPPPAPVVGARDGTQWRTPSAQDLGARCGPQPWPPSARALGARDGLQRRPPWLPVLASWGRGAGGSRGRHQRREEDRRPPQQGHRWTRRRGASNAAWGPARVLRDWAACAAARAPAVPGSPLRAMARSLARRPRKLLPRFRR